VTLGRGRLTAQGQRRIRSRLIGEAGGYLRNVVREPRVTCAVCATPIEASYVLCRRCERDRQTFGDQLADLVVPICYGIRGEQSGHLMYSYKDLVAPVALNRTQLTRVLLAAVALHGACIERRLGENIDAWASVPSTRADRAGEHPLRVLVRQAGLERPEIDLTASAAFDGDPRVTALGRFAVSQPDVAVGRHVLLIEDTWTTGSHCQSAALTLRQAGAASVTTLVLARWLNPEHPPTADFIKRSLVVDYDPLACPLDAP
jgi:hypothetical protein